MIHMNEALIVEGRYDKSKLSALTDAIIVTTNGFGIYKDAEKRDFIRKLAKERGIVVQYVERAKIEALAGGHRHQGVLAYVATPVGRSARISRLSCRQIKFATRISRIFTAKKSAKRRLPKRASSAWRAFPRKFYWKS